MIALIDTYLSLCSFYVNAGNGNGNGNGDRNNANGQGNSGGNGNGDTTYEGWY
jgi:hypothetical protein